LPKGNRVGRAAVMDREEVSSEKLEKGKGEGAGEGRFR